MQEIEAVLNICQCCDVHCYLNEGTRSGRQAFQRICDSMVQECLTGKKRVPLVTRQTLFSFLLSR